MKYNLETKFGTPDTNTDEKYVYLKAAWPYRLVFKLRKAVVRYNHRTVFNTVPNAIK